MHMDKRLTIKDTENQKAGETLLWTQETKIRKKNQIVVKR